MNARLPAALSDQALDAAGQSFAAVLVVSEFKRF
jgi:hypothetical protein